MIQYSTDGNRTAQFHGEMTASLKTSLMFWKILTENILLMTKSAIPVSLKDRWCYDNVDAVIDVDLCTFCCSFYLEPKTCTNIH